MNTALLEELVRRKAEHLYREGVSVAEAIDRAGDEIMNCMADSGGHGSRFCLHMWLQGAKKRISEDRIADPGKPEGDKRFSLIRCAVNPLVNDRPGLVH